jgi:hypothetical protein
MRSGVLAPLREGVSIDGGDGGASAPPLAAARLDLIFIFKLWAGEASLFTLDRESLRKVLQRPAWVVSAEGGGGRPARSSASSDCGPSPENARPRLAGGGSTLARQRKHSPVPKNCEFGCGASVM